MHNTEDYGAHEVRPKLPKAAKNDLAATIAVGDTTVYDLQLGNH